MYENALRTVLMYFSPCIFEHKYSKPNIFLVISLRYFCHHTHIFHGIRISVAFAFHHHVMLYVEVEQWCVCG